MGKHSSKDSNKTKKFFFIIMFAVVIIGVILATRYYNIKKKPENSINNAFSAIKNANKDEANVYVDYEQIIYSLDEMLLEEENIGLEKELFGSIEWKIENIEIKSDNCTATVEVTNKDFIKVMTCWMKKMIGEKEQGKDITNELSLEMLKRALSETADLKTEIKKINLIKENENWKIEVNTELRNLIYPGIDSVINTLNQGTK